MTLNGKLLVTSSSSFSKDTNDDDIPESIVSNIYNDANHRVVQEEERTNGIKVKASYTYIKR